MTTERIWLGILTVLVLGTIVGEVVAIAALRADLDALDRQIAGKASGGWSGPGETSVWSQTPTPQPVGQPSGRIDALVVTSDTFSLTVTVRFSGPADLLFEPPVLEGEKGAYGPTPESLGQARFDFLSLVNTGQTQTTFVFRRAPVDGERLTLVFNPNHEPRDPVAPRWEFPVRSGQ